MIRKHTYFTEQSLKRLAALAEKTGITVAEHMRRAIDAYLAKVGK